MSIISSHPRKDLMRLELSHFTVEETEPERGVTLSVLMVTLS